MRDITYITLLQTIEMKKRNLPQDQGAIYRTINDSCILQFVYAESENYCRDEKSWKEWDALVKKNSNDMEVQALHALRIGLCAKVDQVEITLDMPEKPKTVSSSMICDTQPRPLCAKLGLIKT